MIFYMMNFNSCVVRHHMNICNHCPTVELLGTFLYLINVNNRLIKYSAVQMNRNGELEAWTLGPPLSAFG